jgi:hypothetical protein
MPNNIIVLSADDETAAALVSTIHSAVAGMGKYAAYVEAHKVTRESVKDHARALAVLAYPNDKPVQKVDGKRTRFGNAVQAAGNGLRSALDTDKVSSEPGVIRLTMSGEGGGSVTLKPGDAGYEAAMALIVAGK